MTKPNQKIYTLTKLLAILALAGALTACQAVENRYSPTAMKESFTHKNTSVKYSNKVLMVGASREQVIKVFGAPNGSDAMTGGAVEDVYIFTPDGYKYVSPSPRARNVALGIVTLGTSVAVHQSLLAYQRSNLTIYHVYYNSALKIVRVTKQSAAAFKNPAKP